MKKIIVSIILMAGFIFAYSMQASACGCSPGYWKNHAFDKEGTATRTLYGFCGIVYTDAELYDMLTPQGTLGDKDDREDARDYLNACFPDESC